MQDLMHFQQFPNDPSIILNSRMSTEQFVYVASLPPCQPKASELKGGIFPTKMQGKWLRSFREEHYYKKFHLVNLLSEIESHIPHHKTKFIVLFANNLVKKMPNVFN